VAQIALALIMVTGSGLLLRTFHNMRSVDSGIQPEGVLTVAISASEQTAARAAGLYQRMIDEIDALPGVLGVGAVSALPLDPGSVNGGSFSIRGVEPREEDLAPNAFYAVASAGYLEAIGTRLILGRALQRSDHEQRRAVIVISETFAKAFPGGAAIGRAVMFGGDSIWLEVVGVVQDVRIFGLREDSRPMGYIPMVSPLPNTKIGLMNLVVRTAGQPLDVVDPVRTAIRRIDPNVPIISVRTMQRVMDESMAETSFTMMILMIAAVVAMLLGAIGLYGVIGYVVSQRTAEIGLRIALGAAPERVQRLVLQQGLVLAATGITFGLAGAFAVSQFLESVLFQVDSRDPLTFGLVALVMFGVSGAAAYLPARRAARVSPLQALRME
ncbi:MAG TPA: FtsX-like permease family protein, partial [Longimicrobiales bacterium]|nr:FtsX-like permease family protein [Longimicrobiales bacterium]